MGQASDIFNTCKDWCEKHSTQILTGAAVGGVVLTGIFSFRAGTKASKVLEAKREDWKDIDPDDKEAKRAVIFETVKEMAPSIIPAVGIGIFTVVCCLKSQSINSARIATLSSIAGMTAKQLSDINAELEESFGEKKAKQIHSKAVQRRFNEEAPNDEQELKYLIDCGGDVLCCDIYGDIYFMSTHEEVNQAIEALSYQCADEGNVSLNDLYLKLNIPPKDWAYGVEWNYKDLKYEMNNFGVAVPRLPIETTTIMGFNGKPCIGLRYDIVPHTNDSFCY